MLVYLLLLQLLLLLRVKLTRLELWLNLNVVDHDGVVGHGLVGVLAGIGVRATVVQQSRVEVEALGVHGLLVVLHGLLHWLAVVLVQIVLLRVFLL